MTADQLETARQILEVTVIASRYQARPAVI